MDTWLWPSYFLPCLVPTFQPHPSTPEDLIIPHHHHYESPFPQRPHQKFLLYISSSPNIHPLEVAPNSFSHTTGGSEVSPGCPQPSSFLVSVLLSKPFLKIPLHLLDLSSAPLPTASCFAWISPPPPGASYNTSCVSSSFAASCVCW